MPVRLICRSRCSRGTFYSRCWRAIPLAWSPVMAALRERGPWRSAGRWLSQPQGHHPAMWHRVINSLRATLPPSARQRYQQYERLLAGISIILSRGKRRAPRLAGLTDRATCTKRSADPPGMNTGVFRSADTLSAYFSGLLCRTALLVGERVQSAWLRDLGVNWLLSAFPQLGREHGPLIKVLCALVDRAPLPLLSRWLE
jgi:hypothetical protein